LGRGFSQIVGIETATVLRYLITRRTACLVISALACAVFSGCVHRRMTVRTNPPGARVFAEGKEVGFTPVSLDFTYYGTREITLVKDGYETKTVYPKLKTPWYQYLPFEFVTDNLSPVKINNRHEFLYSLQPQSIISGDDIESRGWELRNAAQFGE